MTIKKFFRMAFGIFLFGAAGLSLTSSVLPTALSTFGLGDSFYLRWVLGDYAAHTALGWAVAGGLVLSRVKSPKLGALALVVVGAATGLALSIAAIGTAPGQLVACALVSAGYSGVGGLLICTILQEHPEEDALSSSEKG